MSIFRTLTDEATRITAIVLATAQRGQPATARRGLQPATAPVAPGPRLPHQRPLVVLAHQHDPSGGRGAEVGIDQSHDGHVQCQYGFVVQFVQFGGGGGKSEEDSCCQKGKVKHQTISQYQREM